jgi:hypothetical protein
MVSHQTWLDNFNGQLPLVVSPIICIVQIARTLVDDGASINILTPAIYAKMQVPKVDILPTHPLHGVLRGWSESLGRIDLLVTFTTEDNFHTETITFNVLNIDLPYNAIIGHLVITKLMVIPHYTYPAFKIQG